ncbi:hypothetical protein [Lactobacillus plantarum subsp. plantarum] [Lactiplantibacillus mudanjiangensis]|uniref:helix-turn-helix transcriptional regulator n=1 Tax=Lactiplantibacillus mudanjiangensis TaxID=1296538 RepID=UPI00101443EE|nr:helix-turn-helix transcriptional regulator [Lactiplantibacillus mudanjiangensis]VDG33334.1 hypothetical protein [Lactobacillus plantarum subsp. plantarum] [Lactiplantibacillus mudanjiangensis]
MDYEINLKLVKSRRIQKGLTQKQMADLLGLEGRSSYNKRENGEINFKSTEIPIISEALGIEIDFKNFFSKTLRKSKRIQDVN